MMKTSLLILLICLLSLSAGASSPKLADFLETETKAGKSVTNSLGMTLCYIPKGSFTMGSPESEKKRRDDENQVSVELTEPFLMLDTEVTQKQWLEVMKMNLQEQIDTKVGALGRGAKLAKTPSALGDDQPMCFVNWDDAMAFCQALTQRERKAGLITEKEEYTLPTEAQWEYACRAGTNTVFSFGNTLTSDQANFYGKLPYGLKEEGLYREKTTVVKTFKPNAWGIYDMHGNVYEWCRDWYADESVGGKDPQGGESGDSRVIRGGTWNRQATSCRSAYRYSYDPTQRTYNIGFRVILQKLKR